MDWDKNISVFTIFLPSKENLPISFFNDMGKMKKLKARNIYVTRGTRKRKKKLRRQEEGDEIGMSEDAGWAGRVWKESSGKNNGQNESGEEWGVRIF